jgi:hypothetical protein
VGLPKAASGAVIASHEHQVARGYLRWPVIGAKIRAADAREAAQKAVRKADRAEAGSWSIQMEARMGWFAPPGVDLSLFEERGWL